MRMSPHRLRHLVASWQPCLGRFSSHSFATESTALWAAHFHFAFSLCPEQAIEDAIPLLPPDSCLQPCLPATRDFTPLEPHTQIASSLSCFGRGVLSERLRSNSWKDKGHPAFHHTLESLFYSTCWCRFGKYELLYGLKCAFQNPSRHQVLSILLSWMDLKGVASGSPKDNAWEQGGA